MDRIGKPLQLHKAAFEIVEAVELASEVGDGVAGQDLAGGGQAAEAGGEVEGRAAIAALDGYRLAGVDADPDIEGQGEIIGPDLREARLQIGGGA